MILKTKYSNLKPSIGHRLSTSYSDLWCLCLSNFPVSTKSDNGNGRNHSNPYPIEPFSINFLGFSKHAYFPNI